VSWKEVIRKLKAAGFVEKRTGKGAHKLFVNPTTGNEVWVTIMAMTPENLAIAS
jgi:predicted RNA binding protein YcfA (HicA-like mRNA interferase family)